jgi:glycosyltransferase involved in cell wall biosynthesis
MSRPRILIPMRHYEPAFRHGGPIRSVTNLVAALHEEFEFRIICLGRDFGVTSPLDGIEEDVWLSRNGAQVRYLSAGLCTPFKLIKTIRATEYDVVYLNSFFEPVFSTLPALLMKIRLLKRTPLVIVPRGEFSPRALELKSTKKALFVRLQSFAGLYAEACWQATTELEAEDIRKALGHKVRVQVAPNLSAQAPSLPRKRNKKSPGRLKVVFLSRISRMKNLLALIRAAGRLRGSVHLDIWGPISDAGYWQQCQQELALLPSNVIATYHGECPHESVADVLEQADVFALPTLGENYGHVIYEALSAGCPVILSDKTPWRNLTEAGVGFDVSLANIDDFVGSMQAMLDMNANEYGAYAERCRNFADRHSSSEAEIEANRRLFNNASGPTP